MSRPALKPSACAWADSNAVAQTRVAISGLSFMVDDSVDMEAPNVGRPASRLTPLATGCRSRGTGRNQRPWADCIISPAAPRQS